jgi:proline dehydrogenase
MLRILFIALSHAEWARRLVMGWGPARRMARRFIAGESQQEAIEAVRRLNAKGLMAAIDVLGESVTQASEATQVVESYLQLLNAISQNGLQASISLKLTALGLDISSDLCRENMRRILETAGQLGLEATIDMEDHTYTQRTIDTFQTLRREDGLNNVLMAVQSYLYRSDSDITMLANDGARLRLCKGAYREPAAVAYPRKSDVDAAYLRQVRILLDAAKEGHGYPGIATHDEKIIQLVKAYVAQKDIPRDCFEFQMLHGIRTNLQEQLVAERFRVRIYVPFGSHWYPYFIRRLAERPANVWFFASNFFRS